MSGPKCGFVTENRISTSTNSASDWKVSQVVDARARSRARSPDDSPVPWMTSASWGAPVSPTEAQHHWMNCSGARLACSCDANTMHTIRLTISAGCARSANLRSKSGRNRWSWKLSLAVASRRRMNPVEQLPQARESFPQNCSNLIATRISVLHQVSKKSKKANAVQPKMNSTKAW